MFLVLDKLRIRNIITHIQIMQRAFHHRVNFRSLIILKIKSLQLKYQQFWKSLYLMRELMLGRLVTKWAVHIIVNVHKLGLLMILNYWLKCQNIILIRFILSLINWYCWILNSSIFFPPLDVNFPVNGEISPVMMVFYKASVAFFSPIAFSTDSAVFINNS